MEWISVKDRLPEPGKYVAMHDDREGSYDIATLDSVTVNGKEVEQVWWIQNGSSWVELDWFTHWVPLPEPPKEE